MQHQWMQKIPCLVAQWIRIEVNVNPEDFVDADQAAALCRFGNAELAELVRANRDVFPAGVAMLPLNNVPVWEFPI